MQKLTDKRTQYFLLLLLPFWLFSAFNSDMNLFGRSELSHFKLPDLKPGDLVFRKEEGLASTAVLMADSRTEYTHVGIVAQNEHGGQVIIHAVPGKYYYQPQALRKEYPVRFVRSSEAIAVFRYIDNEYVAFKASQIAMGFVKDSVQFDAEFDLKTKDKMYCTELVWRAFMEAGVDLVCNEFDKIKIPIVSDKCLLPYSLQQSAFLEKVYPLKTTTQTAIQSLTSR